MNDFKENIINEDILEAVAGGAGQAAGSTVVDIEPKYVHVVVDYTPLRYTPGGAIAKDAYKGKVLYATGITDPDKKWYRVFQMEKNKISLYVARSDVRDGKQ